METANKGLKQKDAFSKLFDEGQSILFMKTKFYGLCIPTFPFPYFKNGESKKFQYFSLNPYKPEIAELLLNKRDQSEELKRRTGEKGENPEKGIRGTENISSVQAFTIEMDCVSLPMQELWVRAILGQPTVQNHSGNKSIHNHFRFDRAISESEKAELIELLKCAFPFSDYGVFSDNAKLVRCPGAIRDNGKPQTILSIGERISYEKTIEILNPFKAKSEPKTARKFVLGLNKNENAKEIFSQELQEALVDLISCGYSLEVDSFEYKTLIENERIAEVITGDTIKIAREKAESAAQGKQKEGKNLQIWQAERQSERKNLSQKAPTVHFDSEAYLQKVIDNNASTLRVIETKYVHGNKHYCLESCLFSSGHSTPSVKGEASIFLTPSGTICYQCFHDSCKGVYTWQDVKAILQNLPDTKDFCTFEEKKEEEEIPNIIFPKPEMNQQQETIMDVLGKNINSLICCSPTGSGKTFCVAWKFLEAIRLGIPVLYIAGHKADLEQFAESIEQAINPYSLEKYKISLLLGGEKIKEEQKKIDNNMDIKKGTLGLITHQTYLKRKGLSTCFYDLIEWMRENKPITFVDEGDAFCNALANIVQIGGRYVGRQAKGDERYWHLLSTCPALSKAGCCQNCTYFEKQRCKANEYSIFEIETFKEIDEKEFNRGSGAHSLKLPAYKISKTMRMGNMKLSQIVQEREVVSDVIKSDIQLMPYRYNFADNEKYDFTKTMEDLIKRAYMPTIYEEILLSSSNDEILKPEDITDENKHLVKFPYHICNTQYFCLKDLSPLEILRRYSRQVFFLSATMSQNNIDFIQAGIPGTEVIKIGESKQKIDELLVIGFAKELSPIKIEKKTRKKHVIFSELEEFGLVLVFEPKASKADQLFRALPRHYPAALYRKDSIEPLYKPDADGKLWKTLITHSRGPIGRAINLPNYFSCIVASKIFKPALALNLQDLSEEELNARRIEDQETIIFQNGGRILRGKGRKIIILTDATKELTQRAANEFAKMSVRTEACFFEREQKSLMETAVAWLKTGQLIFNEKSLEEKAKENEEKAKVSRANVSPKARKIMDANGVTEKIREEKKAEKEGKKEQSFLELCKLWADSEGSWREFMRKWNIARLVQQKKLSKPQIKMIQKCKKNEQHKEEKEVI